MSCSVRTPAGSAGGGEAAAVGDAGADLHHDVARPDVAEDTRLAGPAREDQSVDGAEVEPARRPHVDAGQPGRHDRPPDGLLPGVVLTAGGQEVEAPPDFRSAGSGTAGRLRAERAALPEAVVGRLLAAELLRATLLVGQRSGGGDVVAGAPAPGRLASPGRAVGVPALTQSASAGAEVAGRADAVLPAGVVGPVPGAAQPARTGRNTTVPATAPITRRAAPPRPGRGRDVTATSLTAHLRPLDPV